MNLSMAYLCKHTQLQIPFHEHNLFGSNRESRDYHPIKATLSASSLAKIRFSTIEAFQYELLKLRERNTC